MHLKYEFCRFCDMFHVNAVYKSAINKLYDCKERHLKCNMLHPSSLLACLRYKTTYEMFVRIFKCKLMFTSFSAYVIVLRRTEKSAFAQK
jgi:hypothetical protein